MAAADVEAAGTLRLLLSFQEEVEAWPRCKEAYIQSYPFLKHLSHTIVTLPTHL